MDNSDTMLMKSFYSTAVGTDIVPAANVNFDGFAVKNQFTESLTWTVIHPCLVQNKIPLFVFNDAANKCGVVSASIYKKRALELGIPANEIYSDSQESAVVNILAYKGWFNSKISLITEIAAVQWAKQGFTVPYKSTYASDKCLFTDYLLSSGLCYVEIFKNGTVDRFFATRNVNLLMQLSTAYKDDKTKEPYLRLNKDLGTQAVRSGYLQYLALTQKQIQTGSVPYLKLSEPTKRTKMYSLAMPRGVYSQLRSDMMYRIIPVWMLMEQNKLLNRLLADNVVTITYLKDNMQLRKIVTTENKTALTHALNNNTQLMESVFQAYNATNLMSGTRRVPDLQLTGGDSFLRVLNNRICRLSVCSVEQFISAKEFADLSAVPDAFLNYLAANRGNMGYLQYISYSLEHASRKSWFVQAEAELAHYKLMIDKSPQASAHIQIAQEITADIEKQMSEVLQITHRRTQGKTTDNIYAELVADIKDGVQKRTTEYCRMLYNLITEYPQLFPNLGSVLQANRKSR